MRKKINWGKWIFCTGVIAAAFTGGYFLSPSQEIPEPPAIEIKIEEAPSTGIELADLTSENQSLRNQLELNNNVIESLKKLVTSGLEKREDLTSTITNLQGTLRLNELVSSDSIDKLMSEIVKLTRQNDELNSLVKTLTELSSSNLSKRNDLNTELKKCINEKIFRQKR